MPSKAPQRWLERTRRGVGVQSFLADSNASFGLDRVAGISQCVKECVTAGEIGVTDVHAQLHAARNTIDRAREDIAHTDSRYRIGCTAVASRIFDGQNQFSGCTKSVFTIRHEDCARVAPRAFEKYAEAGWSRNSGHDSDRDFVLFEQRPLLDM